MGHFGRKLSVSANVLKLILVIPLLGFCILTSSIDVKTHGPVSKMISKSQLSFGNIQSFEVKISCQANVPSDTCIFIKNGDNLGSGSGTSSKVHTNERFNVHSDSHVCTLTISNVSQEDVGNYTCLLTNGHGASISTPTSLVYAPLYSQDMTELKYEAKANETLILPCSSSGQAYNLKGQSDGFISYKWSMETGLFMVEEVSVDDSGSKYHILDNGDLVILKTSQKDNDNVFICTQSIDYQDYKLDVKSGKKKVKISDAGIDGSTQFVIYPESSSKVVTAIEGQKYDLNAVFATQSEINWQFNGEDVSLLSNGKLRKNGRILHFNSVERTDAGVYKAFSRDRPEKYVTYIFKVESQPKIENEFEDHVIPHNSTLTFDCSTISPQHSVTYNWYINGKNLKSVLYNGVELSKSDSILSIKDIWNSMVVQCEASNQYGSVLATSVVVVAAKTVSILSDSYSNSFEAGYNLWIALRCPIEYDQNLLPQIIWYYNDEELTMGGKYKMDADSGSLMFKTSQSDGGNYTCLVQTPFDYEMATTRLIMNPDFSGPFMGPWWLIILLLVLCLLMALIIIFLTCVYIRGRRIYYVNKSEMRAGRNSKLFESMRSARSYTLNTRDDSHIAPAEHYHYRVPY